MESKKPLNFAQALRSKPGRPPEAERDAHLTLSVDAHGQETQTPTDGRPHLKEVDAHTDPVDAKTPTLPPKADAKTPTREKRGRQSHKRVDAHKSDRHRADLVRQHFRLNPSVDEKFRLFRAKHNLELQEFYEMAGGP